MAEPIEGESPVAKARKRGVLSAAVRDRERLRKERMAPSGGRRERAQAKRLFHAMTARLNQFVATEGASPAAIAQGSVEFVAQVLAWLSVESGDTPAQLEQRLASAIRALQKSARRYAQDLWRLRSQDPPV